MTRYTASFIVVLLFFQIVNAQDPDWGKLANPGFDKEHIKSAFFFTGNWRNGVQFYDYNPSDNTGLYTIHPADSRHLGWSENIDFRDFAIQTMIDAGVNVINMSYWGLPGTDNWAHWAPMQTSTASHDELFDAALNKDILIAPYIESFAPTNTYKGFNFGDDFPGTISNPAPSLIELIEDLIDRYLINPQNTGWSSKWASVYDKHGEERYLISILHVASNEFGITDKEFAAGFDRVADAVWGNTGIKIGFALDIIPRNSEASWNFKASAAETGPWLYQQTSLIAIQCFIPEIWTQLDNESALIDWKYDFLGDWNNTGIPLIHDISSGYDAHIVFPWSPIYGNNQLWRDLQSELIDELGSQAFTVNAWNGYTEGFAGVPTLQYGDATYEWICDLFGGHFGNNTTNISPPSDQFIEVFPNPVTDVLSVRIKEQGEHFVSCSLSDLNRNTLKTWKPDQHSSMEINIADIPSGLYLMIIKTNKSVSIKKVLKAE